MANNRPDSLNNATIEEIRQAIARIMAARADAGTYVEPAIHFDTTASPVTSPLGSPPSSPLSGGVNGSFSFGVTIDGTQYVLRVQIPDLAEPESGQYSFKIEEGPVTASPGQLTDLVSVTYTHDGPWNVTLNYAPPTPKTFGRLTINEVHVDLNG